MVTLSCYLMAVLIKKWQPRLSVYRISELLTLLGFAKSELLIGKPQIIAPYKN